MVLTARRLLVLTVLTASGAVASATAASVYAAGEPSRQKLWRGARSLNDSMLLASAADTSLPVARRLHSLQQLAAGSCFSVREMLFGTSDERRSAVEHSLALLRPVMPDAPPVESLLRQRAVAVHGVSAADRALRWLLPTTIEERVDFCREFF